MTLQEKLERCDREIAAMNAQPPVQPAWLVTLGVEDWEAEKRFLIEGPGSFLRARENPESHVLE